MPNEENEQKKKKRKQNPKSNKTGADQMQQPTLKSQRS